MTDLNAIAPQYCNLALKREQAQFKIISKIRASLDLDEILQATIQEIQDILGVDRVGVVRLNPGRGWDEGEFIAETVLPRFDSALAARVRDHCFGQGYAEAYKNGRIHAVDDIYAAGLSPCHIEILSQFQVRANLLVPLVRGDMLWGLLCIHQCSGPRHWQADEIEFVSKLAIHLGVAIQHAELLEQTQRQADEIRQTLEELKASHVQLAQAEKMAGLGQLAAGVAHEINNPVSFIQGNLRHIDSYIKDLVHVVMLYREHGSLHAPEIQAEVSALDLNFMLEDLPKLFDSMQFGATRISDIVSALRTFSRLDEMGLKCIDLHESLESTLVLLQHRLQPAGHRPRIKIEKYFSPLPHIECYPGQINQVLMNLLTNAIDALDTQWSETTGEMDPPPVITISTQTHSGTVFLSLKDNGPGIPDDVKARLYDPFFTTKSVGEGTGLGLAIGYQIIANHHGTLCCESTPGQGTEFAITLPIQQAKADTSAPEIGQDQDSITDATATDQPSTSKNLSAVGSTS